MQYKTRFLFPVRWSCFRNFDENGFCWTFNTTSRSLFNSIFHWHYMFQIYIYKNFMSELRIIKLLRIQLCWINAKWFQGSNRILFAQLIVWLMFQNSIQNHHNQSYLSFFLKHLFFLFTQIWSFWGNLWCVSRGRGENISALNFNECVLLQSVHFYLMRGRAGYSLSVNVTGFCKRPLYERFSEQVSSVR